MKIKMKKTTKMNLNSF